MKATCNNSKCVAANKCQRYRDYVKDKATNPFTFGGNKKQPCSNYIGKCVK